MSYKQNGPVSSQPPFLAHGQSQLLQEEIDSSILSTCLRHIGSRVYGQLQAEDNPAQAQLDRFTASIDLCKALGGGWKP